MAKVTLNVGAFDQLTSKAAEGGLRSALGAYERIMKDDVLNRPGTGRQYGKHQASAPGAPPARDRGNLVANTNADPTIRDDGDDKVGSIVAASAYARALHEGTERIEARPFMDVPANENGPELIKAFVDGAKE
jgi:hypothetical protein